MSRLSEQLSSHTWAVLSTSTRYARITQPDDQLSGIYVYQTIFQAPVTLIPLPCISQSSVVSLENILHLQVRNCIAQTAANVSSFIVKRSAKQNTAD